MGAAFLLMMITPDGTFNTNFPANKDSYNYAILNCAAVGTFGYLLSTFTSVFLVMAVQEVSGNIQNVPILLEWLGPLRLFPVWLALVSILALAFALFITLFVVYDPNYTTPLGPKVYHAILGLLLVFGPGLVLMLMICNSVWLTLARGEQSLDDGFDVANRTQSISSVELKEELESYIEEAKGIENINMETYKLRLRIVNPDPSSMGERGESVVNLGQVTELLAEKIFNEKVQEAVEEALAESTFWKGGKSGVQRAGRKSNLKKEAKKKKKKGGLGGRCGGSGAPTQRRASLGSRLLQGMDLS